MHGERSLRDQAMDDSKVAWLAGLQYGVVARCQLRELGLSDDQIDRRHARGALHRLHRGVYAVGHANVDRRGRWLAAVLASGIGAVLSHRSAGELLGILPGSSRASEITRHAGWRSLPGFTSHQGSLPNDETQIVDAIPTTGLSRTVLDLAGRSSQAQVERMLNEAEVLGLTDATSIPMLLERYPRRAGSALLRRVFRERAVARGITRKELERRFERLLDSTDLPEPRRNADIAVGGRFFEVDCLWTEQRLIVELDGRAAHGTEMAFERDRERDRLLTADGWRVARITWRQLHGDADSVLGDLRRMLDA
jgi:very-short-patch-repair endonuclease